MEEITPEQKAYLATFAGQRDAALLEISTLQVAKEKLELANKNLAVSSTEIQNDINQKIGRLAELDKLEREYDDIVSGSLTKHLVEKTRLESEVINLQKIISILTPQKESLGKDISLLTETYNTMENRVGVLNKVIAHVTKVSEDNINKIDSVVVNLKKGLEEIVEVNKKNVAATNQVLTELPRMLVELQKHGLIKNKR